MSVSSMRRLTPLRTDLIFEGVLRGVGLDDFSSTNNSTVGVYIDDVFLASFAEMDFNLYDLGRIEVLKGPQGTLYGRNSTAGAITKSKGPSRISAKAMASPASAASSRSKPFASKNL